ncbi:MAG TPA: NADH-quinone oxidoreductase subunit M [bacterium]|nr:NADH-quinone oxidoreductase subunit M [bacterium]
MTVLGMPILTLIVFLPLAGVAVLLCVNRQAAGAAKWIALGASALTFLVSLLLWAGFDDKATGFQFVEQVSWIPSWGAQYHLGLDGISLWLVLLTTLLTVVAIVGTWNAVERNVRDFMITLLLLEVGMNGVFVALDMFLFYVFWEVMLFPMYFLIGVWGSERRLYAAIKFVVYTMSASVLMLVAILAMYFLNARATGQYSFNLLDWYKLSVGLPAQYWLFGAFALAFAVKVPMWPLHTWLPDAHVEAPTAGSVILAGVLLKMGTYGFLRFAMPLFPTALRAALPWLMALALIGIIYGALVCMVQPDMKKLVAYSSVSHLGFVMLGLFALNAQGVQGSILQMINHGISTGGLFLMVGIVYERRHTKAIAEFGGLIKIMPLYSAVSVIIVLSSIGLPSLNGFVGEYLILLGAFLVNPVYAAVAAVAVILAAVYLLWLVQRVFFGPVTNEKNKAMKDLSWRELTVFAPLLLLIVWVGVYPQTFLGKTETSVNQFLGRMNGAAVAAAAPAAQPEPTAQTVPTPGAALHRAVAAVRASLVEPR